MLMPLHAGRVIEIPARESEQVQAGAALLRLDDQAARHQLANAEARLAAARLKLAEARRLQEQHQARLNQQRALIAAAEHRATAARRLRDRQRELQQSGQLNRHEAELAEDRLQEAAAVLRVEEARLSELQAHDPALAIQLAHVELTLGQVSCQEAQDLLQNHTVRAPAAGTVVRILVAVGDVVGGPASRPALIFSPAGPRIIRAEVPQEHAHLVRVGQAVQIEDEGHSTATWSGRVVRLSDWFAPRRSSALEPGEAQQVHTLECLVSVVEDAQAPLRLGQRVRVHVEGPVSAAP